MPRTMHDAAQYIPAEARAGRSLSHQQARADLITSFAGVRTQANCRFDIAWSLAMTEDVWNGRARSTSNMICYRSSSELSIYCAARNPSSRCRWAREMVCRGQLQTPGPSFQHPWHLCSAADWAQGDVTLERRDVAPSDRYVVSCGIGPKGLPSIRALCVIVARWHTSCLSSTTAQQVAAGEGCHLESRVRVRQTPPKTPGDGTPFRQCVALGSGLTSFVDQVRNEQKNIMLINTPNRGIGNGDLPLHYRRHHLPAPQTHPANAASIGARGAVVHIVYGQHHLQLVYAGLGRPLVSGRKLYHLWLGS
ncbi:hypothetical protein QBC36DRAFT_309967 [Triangularia setosa]|uniref:Uncharacterized protein n=1 Tax=Triangularia setosa TaxID=2587417 RepID=A0AAN6W8Z2_9PEZI|nr:hypothetical protein QBC36DRAFT_309967 [Podospora setosa]